MNFSYFTLFPTTNQITSASACPRAYGNAGSREALGTRMRRNSDAEAWSHSICIPNLVPRACDPWEGNEGSGIIRCRKPGILAKIELRIHFNGQSDSSLKRIIPEPSFPSKGSQARGTRLMHSSLKTWRPQWMQLYEEGRSNIFCTCENK